MNKILLRGSTWDHSRGFLPMAATGQRFHETHPEVEILWEKRSLQEFADAPLSFLAEKYDLLVIDHPWAGYGAAHGALLPLDEWLPAEFLDDQRRNQVGRSHDSYCFDGRQTALAIDAAAPVASWRPDLIEEIPGTWEQMIDLARGGRVIIPAIPIDSLMNFYMVCEALGEEPFTSPDTVVSTEVGVRALHLLRELAALCSGEVFGMNPIAVYETLSATDSFCYCPFAYGYSNYAGSGYGAHRLTFGDIPRFGARPMRSVLGGTGLAISATTAHPEVAVEYARLVAGPDWQRTIYTASGGQPGHRDAWLDSENNRVTDGYFRDTLPVIDRAWLRPRYDGYLHFQDSAGDLVCDFMKRGGDAGAVLSRFDSLYRQSLPQPAIVCK